MFTIEDNVITFIQGDTGNFDLSLDNYILTDGDVAYFTIKKSIADTENVLQVEVNSFENGIAKFFLDSSMTNIEAGRYVYDIEVSLSDGQVDTVIPPSKLKVLRGVKS